MEERTFTDRYGDSIDIQIYETVVDFSGYSGREHTSHEFSRDQANDIARFILGEPEVADAKAPVDPVSLFSGESGSEREEWNRVAALAAHKLGLGLSFRYTKTDTAPVETRTLTKVTDVVKSPKGHFLVIGHSDERDDARSFRIDRIVSYAQVS